MKERPILFSGAMVRAILDGSKTQTRRVMKVQPTGEGYITSRLADSTFAGDRKNIGRLHWIKMHDSELRIVDSGDSYFTCPYGKVGDRLWVRETSIISPKNFSYKDDSCVTDYDGDHRFIQYLATHSCREAANDYKLKATPSIHMPRWASRITLEIVNIRVERLQDISDSDAWAEGVETEEALSIPCAFGAIAAYSALWESINGTGSWDLNPWVWVIEFRRV